MSEDSAVLVLSAEDDPDRDKKGQFVKGNSLAISVHPDKDPVQLAKKSHEVRRLIKEDAVAAAIAEVDGGDGTERTGAEVLAGEAVKRAMGDGHVAVTQFRDLMAIYSPDDKTSDPVPPGGVRLDMGAEAARELLLMLATLKRG